MFRLPIVKFFNRIFNRVTITVVLVALQVLWLLWAFWSFTAGRVWLNGALKALSIMIVLYLVRKDENSAYKIGWIVLIGLLPLLGGALYLAFGNKAPAKYLRERMQKVEQAHQTELAQPEGQTDALDISSRNLSRYVAKFGPYPAWKDTAAHYFSCGEEMYPQLLADLDKAEKFIFLEFFILRSGKMWDGVEQILRRCAACGTLLVVDECFLDFLPDHALHTAKGLLGEGNLVILEAFTKLYGMAGVRLGYCLCGDETLLEKMQTAGQPWAVSSLAQAAGVAALKETAYVDEVRALIARQRPVLTAGLRALGLRVIDGKANYLLFRAPADLNKRLRPLGTQVRSCANYPGLGPEWYRTAVRTAPENARLLELMKEVLG